MKKKSKRTFELGIQVADTHFYIEDPIVMPIEGVNFNIDNWELYTEDDYGLESVHQLIGKYPGEEFVVHIEGIRYFDYRDESSVVVDIELYPRSEYNLKYGCFPSVGPRLGTQIININN